MRNFVWEQKYAKFEEHVGMPKITSTLNLWKQTQLAIGPAGLDARIAKEIEENEGFAVWSDRIDFLKSVKWETQYAEFEEHVGMPERKSTLDNWKTNQVGY